MAVRQAALVNDESALEACFTTMRYTNDDLYLFYLYATRPSRTINKTNFTRTHSFLRSMVLSAKLAVHFSAA